MCYFSFQPVYHNCGMCYPVSGMVHIKEPLLSFGKGNPCSGHSDLSDLLPYVRVI